MTSKKGGLSSMDAIANTNKGETNTNMNNATNETNITGENNVTNEDNNKTKIVKSIDEIMDEIDNKPKSKPKRQIAIYIDEDVAKAFDKYGKKHGKGAKSELLNQLLKASLTSRGFMD